MADARYFLMFDEADGRLWKIPESSVVCVCSDQKMPVFPVEEWREHVCEARRDIMAFMSSDVCYRTMGDFGVHVVFEGVQSNTEKAYVYTCIVNVQTMRSTRFVWALSYAGHAHAFSAHDDFDLEMFPPISKTAAMNQQQSWQELEQVGRERMPRPRTILGASPVEGEEWGTILGPGERRFFVDCCTSTTQYRNSTEEFGKFLNGLKCRKEKNPVRVLFESNMQRYQEFCQQNMKRDVDMDANSLNCNRIRSVLGDAVIGTKWADAVGRKRKFAHALAFEESKPTAVSFGSLPQEVVELILGRVVDDAICNPDVRLASRDLGRLALTCRQFNRTVFHYSADKISDAVKCVSFFVATGEARSREDVLGRFLSLGGPNVLPYVSYCFFGCSPTTLLALQRNTLHEFLAKRSASALSCDVCSERAEQGIANATAMGGESLPPLDEPQIVAELLGETAL